MVDLGEQLYRISWGFAILWLGVSVIIGYLGGLDILGVYLCGVGVYGLFTSLYAYVKLVEKTYLVFISASIISLIIGISFLAGGIIDPIILTGIVLITIGVMVIIYYLI